ncbi:MAG: glycerophosphodiester phosphodiesterase family protein, partial [Candidatus Hydrogenedentes bacterium]|nr:glycerophosphodiester phosphodiesterase family protein [Candidatus Hydrogenedentota bacterium]
WTCLFVGCALMGGCMSFEAGAPEGRVDIIAHRGASAYAPENTLAAFSLAADMGADWFELDCTLTKDGEVIVIHDDTIGRTTGAEGTVLEMTLAELKRYDAGTWFDPKFAEERLPTLGEALDLAKDRRIGVYIEIKDSDDDRALNSQLLDLVRKSERLLPDHAEEMIKAIEASGSRNLELTRSVIALIRERKMAPQVVIQSFSAVVCAVALIEAPDIRTELLASSSNNDPLQWNRYLRWLKLLDPPGFNINKKDFTQGLLADLHDSGKTMALYTVNDPAQMRDLIRAGVDALITNKPDVGNEVRASEGN